MYIQLSFPIVDLRPFVEEDTRQIGVPMWNYDKDTQGEFVRHFGHVRFANRFVKHLSQTPFSKAKGALKLPHWNTYNFLNDGEDRGPIQSPYPHRRLFVFLRRSDDQPFSCEARFDFGVKIAPSRPAHFDIPDLVNAEESIHKLIRRFLDFPVEVGALEGQERFLEPVAGQVGPSLANLYLYCSSQRNRRDEVKKYWIKSLLPTVVLQIYGTPEAAPGFLERIDPKKIIREFTTGQLHLVQFDYEAFGKTIPVWLLIRHDRSEEARRLEQQIAWNITKGHAEYQTAVYLANLAAGNRLKFTPRSEASQRFQYFIDQVLKTLPPGKNAPQSEKALFQAIAQNHYQAISVQDCLRLMKNLSHIRKNLQRKFANFSVSKDPNADVPIERLADDRQPRPPSYIGKKYLDEAEPFVKEKNLQGFEDYIRYLVGESRVKKSLELLRAYLKLSNVEGYPLNYVELQLSRYNSVHQNFTLGVISHEEYTRETTPISYAILSFFEELTV
jgi:hypothetical protein